MPNSETFLYSYLFGATMPDENSVYGPPLGPFSFDVVDALDGAEDGQTEVDDDLRVSTAPGDTYTLVGFTSNGDPVLMSPGNYFVASNDSGLSGNIGFTTTGGPYLYCFAEATMIATPGGDVPVERLKIGDQVATADGSVVPVKWVGRQTIATLFAGERARMVRIAKGVLGNHSELHVTPDHGMIVDDLVINAGALVDIPGIDLVPLSETPDRFAVYHIETENHDVILANGAASETFIDAVSRSRFDNYQDYLDLYGTERIIPEMDRLRVSSRRLVPQAIKSRLGRKPGPISHSA